MGCFNPDTNSWSLVAPLPSGHGEPGVAVLDNSIYVVGGRSHNKGNRKKYVHVYSGDSDEWTSGVEVCRRVSGLAACAALMPPAVLAAATRWQQRTKSWTRTSEINGSESSED